MDGYASAESRIRVRSLTVSQVMYPYAELPRTTLLGIWMNKCFGRRGIRYNVVLERGRSYNAVFNDPMPTSTERRRLRVCPSWT